MLTRFFPLIAAASLSACAYPVAMAPAPRLVFTAPVPAAPVNPGSARERFLDAAAVNGCEVNATNSAAILASATLSQQDLARVMTDLRATGGGEIGADGRSFRVTAGRCI